MLFEVIKNASFARNQNSLIFYRSVCRLSLGGRGATHSEKRLIFAVDGPSGVGKTTIVGLLAEHLMSRGFPSLTWTNADDQTFGPIIRRMAKTGKSHLALTLALAAARAQLVETRPSSEILLCDRFIASSLVYQVYAGVPVEFVVAVNAPFMRCACHIILAIDATNLEARRWERAAEKRDWFKHKMPLTEELALYEAARGILAANGAPPVVVDASQPLGATVADVCRAVDASLAE